jgi:hypothetical protein
MKLSTSTDSAIEASTMKKMNIFFSLWISTSLGISVGICAIGAIIIPEECIKVIQ